MRRMTAALLIAASMTAGAAAQDSASRSGPLDFAQYPATDRFQGRPAAPNFATTPEEARFRSHIEAAQRQHGVNFAGAYTIATWPCLSLCVSVVAVDARTGLVVRAPEAYNGLSFRRDSRLLVINPPERIPPDRRADPPAEMRPEYYEFTGREFRRLDFPDVNAVGVYRPGDPLPNLPRPPTDVPGTGWGSGQFGSQTGDQPRR